MAGRHWLVMLLALAACGGGGAARPATPTASEPATVPSVAATPPPTISRPAVATTPADRVDDPIRLAWIGGSEVALREVSLPDALRDRFAADDGPPVDVVPYTQIAPMPDDMAGHLTAAIAAGADALLISINIAWLHWEYPACEIPDGHPVDPVERYACVLSPQTAEITERRRADLEDLIDAVVATGLPSYLYLLPHSTTALADPRIADLIEAREAELATFDPDLDRVEFVARSFTRGHPGFDQPAVFVDMVHPTAHGATVLVEQLARQLYVFWDAVGLART